MSFTATIIIAAIVLLVAVGALARVSRRSTRQPEALERSDWSMYHSQGENGPSILQSLGSPPSDQRRSYKIGVVIEWTYANEGLPDRRTLQQMYALEDALRPMREDRTAIHVHTLTGEGVREWCYYTADRARFEVDFNSLVASLPKMPLQILFDLDPNWSYWQKVKSGAAA